MLLNNELLETGTPESVGISSESIIDLIQTLQERQIECHSFQIIRRHRLICSADYEPYRMTAQHRLFSAAKGIVALGILFLIQEGKLTEDTRIVDLLPEAAEAAAVDSNGYIQRLTLYHLLTMNSGQEEDTCMEMFLSSDWIRAFFRVPFVHFPGTWYTYNNGIPHILAAIVQRVSGQLLDEYLTPRLLDPLGIIMLCRPNAYGEYEPSNVCMSQESLTKLGLFMLDGGSWNGRQLLQPELIRRAGSYQVPVTGVIAEGNLLASAGYGYQLWRNPFGGYRFDGGRDQHAVIIPEEEMVFSCMGNVTQQGGTLKAFWDTVFSHLYARALPENPAAQEKLEEQLEKLTLAPTEQLPPKKAEAAYEALAGRRYRFEDNPLHVETLRFEKEDDGYINITDQRNGTVHSMRVGTKGQWAECREYLFMDPDRTHGNFINGEDEELSYASSAWENDHTMVIYGRGKSRMHTDRWILIFNESELTVKIYTSILLLPGFPAGDNKGEFVLRAALAGGEK